LPHHPLAFSTLSYTAEPAHHTLPALVGRSPDSGKPFNFALIYGNDRGETGFACTRRVWRVFTLASPSLLDTFLPFTDGMGTFGYGEGFRQPYPFSVKVGPDLDLFPGAL